MTGIGAVLLPAVALAHASPGGFVLLLPTGYWMAGGAAAVALSFAALALAPGERLARAFGSRIRTPIAVPGAVVALIRWLAFAEFMALIVEGFTGPTDPLSNALPLTLWTMTWVGLTLASAILGDVWRVLNPWTAPFRMAQRAGLARREGLPGWAMGLGHWPAVSGLLAFGWFELVHVSPQDPALLARVVLAYWAVTFLLMLAAGEEWLRRGEFLTVFFGLVARLAPLSWQDRRLTLSLPGGRLTRAEALPLSAGIFVTTALATVSFDGLSRTFFWLDLIGINPLDFPGRSAVTGVNTLGYLGAVAAMAAVFGGAVLLSRQLSPPPVSTGQELGRLALTLLPIALAYHASHYLTVLMVNGQYWLAATVGWWIGYDSHDVTTSFFHDRSAVEAIWTVQAGTIIAGHLLAVLLAHLVADGLHQGDLRAAVRGQLPLAALMVLYTVAGLWLLASPTGA